MKNNVGTRVSELCKETGTSHAELERELNIANGSVSRWTKGAMPGGAALDALSKKFKVSTDWLLGLTKYRTPKEEFEAKQGSCKNKQVETIAAHLDDVDLTDEEAMMLELYIKSLVKNKK